MVRVRRANAGIDGSAGRFAIVLLALCALFLLAACGGGGDKKAPLTAQPTSASTAAVTRAPASVETPVSSVAIDPCTLATRTEIEAAIGAAVLDPKREQYGNLGECNFNEPAHPSLLVVGVSVLSGARPSDARADFDSWKTQIGGDQQTVAGFGEDAYWKGGLTAGFFVVQDRYSVSIHVSGVAPDGDQDRLAIAEDIAMKVLSRLPRSE